MVPTIVNAMPPQLTVEAYFKGELFVAAVPMLG